MHKNMCMCVRDVVATAHKEIPKRKSTKKKVSCKMASARHTHTLTHTNRTTQRNRVVRLERLDASFFMFSAATG